MSIEYFGYLRAKHSMRVQCLARHVKTPNGSRPDIIGPHHCKSDENRGCRKISPSELPLRGGHTWKPYGDCPVVLLLVSVRNYSVSLATDPERLTDRHHCYAGEVTGLFSQTMLLGR